MGPRLLLPLLGLLLAPGGAVPACPGISSEPPLFPGKGQSRPLSEGLRRFRWSWQDASHPGKREELAGKTAGIAGSSRFSDEAEDGKRSYSMEHFRWGKPVGRKRRPVKVYPNGAEEESEENSRPEFRRGESSEEEEEEFPEFPWDSRKEKRYGGFMSSERIRTPLVTLFKNAIGKSFAKDGQ
ncbi:pro-opiomelanocortin [Lonchura striata]